MCGIAGIVSFGGNRTGAPLGVAATRMAATLAHRGPDDAGVWQSADDTVALAHRRLSIIDLSPLGHNPMPWDGGRLWITFNGEIYNFLDLRRELEHRGHRFRSQSDTEAILAAYDEWGIDSVHRLVGMFAFALWDSGRRSLWLVRDRLGKKPLYYAERSGVLRFGSELKALVADPDFPTDVDGRALRLYLQYGYVPSPFTIYAVARKLPPAHYLLCEDGHIDVRRYWNPADYHGRHATVRPDEAEAILEEKLATAVRQRRTADVPLGAFLSGGIDSSLIVALMQEQTRTPVRTFTIRFRNPQFNEADHAAAVAHHLGTDHDEELCDEQQMLSLVDRLPAMYDEPFADSSAVPTFLVSRAARRSVTVALSGDGGDELFFGYPRYRYHSLAASIMSLPQPLLRTTAALAGAVPLRPARRIAAVLRTPPDDPYSGLVTWWSPQEVFELTGRNAEVAPLYGDALAVARQVPRDDRPGLLDLASYLPEDILTKVDRASMAVSLEVRAPLLDHRVVEYTLGLPAGQKRRHGTTKWLLRKLLYKRVPPVLVERRKMGFGVPLADWFRGPLRGRMDDLCRGDIPEQLGLDPRPITRTWAEFGAGQVHNDHRLWNIFALLLWAESRRSMSRVVPGATGARLASAPSFARRGIETP